MNQLRPLTIKEVTPYIVPNPVGIDLVCKSLQESLGALTFIEKSFARAVMMTNKQDDKERVFPAMFVANGFDYLDMMQTDNYQGYSFMIARDGEKVEDYEEGIQNTLSRTLSLIFWFDLQQIDKARSDDFLEELKRDIVKAIKNTRFLYESNGARVMGLELLEIFDEPKNIFKGFTDLTTPTQFLYYPYKGLRVDLKAYYTEECN